MDERGSCMRHAQPGPGTQGPSTCCLWPLPLLQQPPGLPSGFGLSQCIQCSLMPAYFEPSLVPEFGSLERKDRSKALSEVWCGRQAVMQVEGDAGGLTRVVADVRAEWRAVKHQADGRGSSLAVGCPSSNSGPRIYQLCDFRQVTYVFCASASSFIKWGY